MKIRVKCDASAYTCTVPEGCTFGELKKVVLETVPSLNAHVGAREGLLLSLNKRDALEAADSDLLSTMGLRNGDALWVLTPTQPATSARLPSAARPAHASSSGHHASGASRMQPYSASTSSALANHGAAAGSSAAAAALLGQSTGTAGTKHHPLEGACIQGPAPAGRQPAPQPQTGFHAASAGGGSAGAAAARAGGGGATEGPGGSGACASQGVPGLDAATGSGQGSGAECSSSDGEGCVDMEVGSEEEALRPSGHPGPPLPDHLARLLASLPAGLPPPLPLLVLAVHAAMLEGGFADAMPSAAPGAALFGIDGVRDCGGRTYTMAYRLSTSGGGGGAADPALGGADCTVRCMDVGAHLVVAGQVAGAVAAAAAGAPPARVLTLSAARYTRAAANADAAATAEAAVRALRNLPGLWMALKDDLVLPLQFGACEARGWAPPTGPLALPWELQEAVLTRLGVRELLSLAGTCTQLRLRASVDTLWRALYKRELAITGGPAAPGGGSGGGGGGGGDFLLAARHGWKEAFHAAWLRCRRQSRMGRGRYACTSYPPPWEGPRQRRQPLQPPGIVGGDYDRLPAPLGGVYPHGPLGGVGPTGLGGLGALSPGFGTGPRFGVIAGFGVGPGGDMGPLQGGGGRRNRGDVRAFGLQGLIG